MAAQMEAQPTTTVVVDLVLGLSARYRLIACSACTPRTVPCGYLFRQHDRQLTVLEVLADAQPQRDVV